MNERTKSRIRRLPADYRTSEEGPPKGNAKEQIKEASPRTLIKFEVRLNPELAGRLTELSDLTGMRQAGILGAICRNALEDPEGVLMLVKPKEAMKLGRGRPDWAPLIERRIERMFGQLQQITERNSDGIERGRIAEKARSLAKLAERIENERSGRR
ncbi:MAG TPA: hypothetical protein DEA96_05700 [Leptospiraceae bacterium]|nr:hypothetical protein [Spirochaetaceae bacterium]HBS04437.1 hypothetical protein [Leptospiraceae bacterium]|tara:strand:- start:5703 stop:6173 length:471 start_codon:yes stop_codon:yes gene_type:complete